MRELKRSARIESGIKAAWLYCGLGAHDTAPIVRRQQIKLYVLTKGASQSRKEALILSMLNAVGCSCIIHNAVVLHAIAATIPPAPSKYGIYSFMPIDIMG
jgi:hypothetical protein